jgi:hypothetical protein
MLERAVEPEALPERIGYADPFSTVQLGVFEDRRSRGLGFALIQATEIREVADLLLSEAREYPRFLRQRIVVSSPWTAVTPPEGTGRV